MAPCHLGSERRQLRPLTMITCPHLLQGSSNLYNFKSHLQETLLKIAIMDDQTKIMNTRFYYIHTKISVKHLQILL